MCQAVRLSSSLTALEFVRDVTPAATLVRALWIATVSLASRTTISERASVCSIAERTTMAMPSLRLVSPATSIVSPATAQASTSVSAAMDSRASKY